MKMRRDTKTGIVGLLGCGFDYKRNQRKEN